MMNNIKTLQDYVFIILFLLLATTLSAQTAKKVAVNKNTFGAIEARHIGPAVMSGRIAALDAVQNDPRIIYVGSASGGLWKSTNGGVQFKAVFDKHCQSIGAVCIDQQHPDTVWVGTGESWTRNSTSVGDGVYRSYDAGESWENMGLHNSERISQVIIHPSNPNTIYIAVLGHLWNANEERGVYKTTDGGQNWESILFIDENTGCSDLAIDPSNPDIIYAGMWDFRRSPDFFRSGGPGSGLYISRDGGSSWEQVKENLPKGTIGRIALSVSSVDPNIVYALIEAEKSALYKSEDKGLNWEIVNKTPDMGKRPFYFSNIMADPIDTNTVYKPGFIISVSENKGKTFRPSYVTGGNVHVDMHALWISKKDNNLLYLGTDGGFYISNDKGGSWRFCRNLPVSQFYHVSVDNQKPYNVYGGLQDNGSWMASTKNPGGVLNEHWKKVGGGDGFYVFPDETDEDILYWQYQGGNIFRRYLSTGESKEIKPFSNEDLDKLRFNWNTPLAFGGNGKSMYLGSQYLFKTNDKGDSWQRISPDLTTNDPQKQRQAETGGVTIDNSTAENHCTIITINESLVDENIIWVGTDDGNLQLTIDGGINWNNLIENIDSLPEDTWVSYVCPSRYDKATAYVTFDGHRTGDMNAWVFKTTDLGESWTLLSKDQIGTYCYKIIEDSQNPNLLFLGTEKGLYVSIDGGEVWSQFKGNLPDVSVRDIVIQERENDLVIGTHGRGIMIIDDISPLRVLSEDLLQEDLAFLPSRPYELGVGAGGGWFSGDDDFYASNAPQSVSINYYLKKRHVFGDMHIQIYNKAGEMIKEIPAGKRKGINRVSWQMRMKAPKVPSSPQLTFGAFYGPTYPPGTYTIKILKKDKSYEGQVEVIYDPTVPHTIADRDERQATIMEAYSLLENLAFLDEQLTSIRDQAKNKSDSSNNKTLSKKLGGFSTLMDELHSELVATKEGIAITGEEKLRERISSIYSSIMGYQGKPTQSQLSRLEAANSEFVIIRAKADQYLEKDIPNFNSLLEKEKMNRFHLLSKEEFMEEDK